MDRRRVVILVEDMYNELEFWYPFYRLKEAGAEVVVVSGTSGEYKSKTGLPCRADTGADQIHVGDFDAIIIPGGFAPDLMRRSPAMVQLVRDFHDAGKIVAAICHAGWMLASAQILEGRTVTSFFSIKDDMIHAGAKWVDMEVVVDGNLITSRKPDDLPAFMKSVLNVLK